MNRRLKAQSAMEYLMTYGWAILIIAVVLGALFSLGVFSGTSLLGTSCIASSGFFCGSLTFSHTTGNIVVTIGQNTGSTWTAWGIMYAPQGTPMTTNAANVLFTVQTAGAAQMTSGQQISGVTLPATAPSVAVGTTTAGSIWVCYSTTSTPVLVAGTGALQGSCTATSGSIFYNQIATLTAKAT